MKAKMKSTGHKRATCPDCGSSIMLKRPELDEQVLCPECESDLIVVKLNPLKLDWAYDDSDDDDDGDYDDDDDGEEYDWDDES